MRQKFSGCEVEDFRTALSAERSGSHLALGQDYTGDHEVTPNHMPCSDIGFNVRYLNKYFHEVK